jgi:hypothetical protein
MSSVSSDSSVNHFDVAFCPPFATCCSFSTFLNGFSVARGRLDGAG